MFGLGIGELLIILAIVVLLFGAKKIPDLATGIGKGIRGFKAAVSGADEPRLIDQPHSSNEQSRQ
ncbi:MAG: twin-arginine translocase TatA/TatE family subunit [Deltaproteobacteria bacterium]|nr:twin-arginine translocase TatA/TatE family subunit [Deltaproteobacteria bacterium]